MSEKDRRIADAIEREQRGLRNFIRKRVPEPPRLGRPRYARGMKGLEERR